MKGEEISRARAAAITEVLKEIRDGMVIGYGSGTTVAQFLPELKKLMESKNLHLRFIPSSLQSKELLTSYKLELAILDEAPSPDLVIDSFDQVDYEGNAIKGGGGALLREKVLAQAAKKVIYLGDHLKLKEVLNFPIPIEVLEYSYPHVKRILDSWNMRLRPRTCNAKMGPLISDNGNILADVEIGEIRDPEMIHEKLKSVAGILETGIFLKAADLVIIGYPDGSVKRINPSRRKLIP
ncbi:MAG: ribose 5-phosphate isomerase A [Nitrososphaeria archaeon]|nr:ribose 5-phosphate isomerase A [Nitrososphaeria archaeon]